MSGSLSFELSGHGAIRLKHSEHRIVITGASGWLGMASIDLLRQLLADDFASRVACFGSTARSLQMLDGALVEQRGLGDLGGLDRRPTLLLHFAFLTREKAAQMPLSEYLAHNRSISAHVLECAERIGVDAVMVASSGAVYNADRSLAHDAALNPYGVLKLEDEARFSRWAQGHGHAISVARIFNLSGRYINKLDSYALASLILDAIHRRPFKINANVPVVRSYVPVTQVLSVALGDLLADGTEPVSSPWDTAGSEEIELSQLAFEIGRAMAIPLNIERPALVGAAAHRYVGEPAAFNHRIGRFGIQPAPLALQIMHTARYLAAISGHAI